MIEETQAKIDPAIKIAQKLKQDVDKLEMFNQLLLKQLVDLENNQEQMKHAMGKVKEIAKEVHYNSFELHKQDEQKISILQKKIDVIYSNCTLKSLEKKEEQVTFYNK